MKTVAHESGEYAVEPHHQHQPPIQSSQTAFCSILLRPELYASFGLLFLGRGPMPQFQELFRWHSMFGPDTLLVASCSNHCGGLQLKYI